MPQATGIAGFGTLLKIGDGQASEGFATIAEVTDITWGGMKAKTSDLTNHSSPSAFNEIVPTTVDPGQIKFSVNFLPSAITQGYATGLMRDFINRNKRNFQLVFPNVAATTWQCSAYVTSCDIKAPVNDVLSADFQIDITGLSTFA